MKLFHYLLLLFLVFVASEAMGGVWFYGSGEAVCLEEQLGFSSNDQKFITGDADDPTSVAKTGAAGSLYLRTNGLLYVKQDGGSSTNWEAALLDSSVSGVDNFVPLFNGTNALDSSAVDETELNLLNGRTYIPDVTGGTDGGLPIFSAANGIDNGGFAASTGAVSLNAGAVEVGTLPVARGGTNSSTALNNNFVMVSNAGAIAESATVTTTELGLLDGRTYIPDAAGANTQVAYFTAANTLASDADMTFDGTNLEVAGIALGGTPATEILAGTPSADSAKLISLQYFDDQRVEQENLSDTTSWTPTGSWTSNTTYTGNWYRVGEFMYMDILITLTGAPNATNLTVDIPSGYTIATAKLATTSFSFVEQSVVRMNDSSAGQRYYGAAQYLNTTTLQPKRFTISGSSVQDAAINATSPITFASGDSINIKAKIPITGWSSDSSFAADLTKKYAIAYHQDANNCEVTATAGAASAWTNFGTDTDCPGPTVLIDSGITVDTTDDDTAAEFTVTSLPAGTYLVRMCGKFGINSTQHGGIQIYDGSSGSAASGVRFQNGYFYHVCAERIYDYASTSNRTFQFRSSHGGGVMSLQNYRGSGGTTYKAQTHFYIQEL